MVTECRQGQVPAVARLYNWQKIGWISNYRLVYLAAVSFYFIVYCVALFLNFYMYFLVQLHCGPSSPSLSSDAPFVYLSLCLFS